MYVEPVSVSIGEVWEAERFPHRRTFMELLVALVGDRQVVDSLDMWCFSQVLHGGDKSLGTWVQEMLGLGLLVLFAPQDRLLVLLPGEPCCLTEADQPCRCC